jgi:hypothetical protein
MKSENIRIYLDDERETPEGFVRTYSVEETIKLIKEHDGKIYMVSLDNDLGTGCVEGKEVMRFIEQSAFDNTLKPIPHLIIHTQNTSAAEDMRHARYNAWKYWMGHGYKRADYI